MKFVKPNGSVHDAGPADSRLNLLAHAQMIELEIGSECGGHGHCGGDRVRLARGARVSAPSPEEREHLSAEELAQGWRLACQCFPEPSQNGETELVVETPRG